MVLTSDEHRRILRDSKRLSVVRLTPKEIQDKIAELQEGIKETYEVLRTLLPEAIIEGEAKDFGNSSHIILPKEYAGKKAIVLIKEK